MPITPDAKDWTWVLERPCPECGFDASSTRRATLAARALESAAAWRDALNGEDVVTRRDENAWSTLEYGCHVRDVYRVMDGRLRLLLEEDEPVFQNWDQDETALEERYDLQSPSVVADELSDAAVRYAARLADVTPDQWSRQGTRSNGSVFSVETLATYCLHDVVHHLWDVSPTKDSLTSRDSNA